MDEYNYTPELYTLVDDEGVAQTFEMLDAIEIGDDRYYAMVPYFEDPNDLINANGELVILKSDYVDGEEMLVSIDDDEEFDRMATIFMKRLEEMFDGEDDECGCGHCHCDDDDCDCDDDDHGCGCGCCHHS